MPLLVGISVLETGNKKTAPSVNSNAEVVNCAVGKMQSPASTADYPCLRSGVSEALDFFTLRYYLLRFVMIAVPMVGMASVFNTRHNLLEYDRWHKIIMNS